MAFIRANNIVLHHQVLGREGAPALVFANSLGSDFRIWQEVAPAFRERYRVVLYDKRGHGLSDAPPAPYTIDQHTDDLLALLDHLRIEKAAIVGLSVGGMIAQRMAIRTPQRVGALVLCDTAAKIGTSEMWAERIAAVEQAGIESIADNVLQRWFTPAFRQERRDEWAGWRNMLVRTPAHGYAGTCAAIRDADLTARRGAYRRPDTLSRRRSGWLDAARSRAPHRESDPRRALRDHRGGWPHPLHRAAGGDDTAHRSTSCRRRAMSEDDRSERYKAGMAVRRKVLGDAHVDRASAQITDLDADFQTFITEGAWGSVWSRPNFTLARAFHRDHRAAGRARSGR